MASNRFSLTFGFAAKIGNEPTRPADDTISRIEKHEPAHWQQVIEGMLLVTEGQRGTAKALAKGIRYVMAGKTGTAQKAVRGRGYVDGKYVASFVGFAPVSRHVQQQTA